jgi:hypothetical protein
MTWNNVTESSNTWENKNPLYVVEGYWQEGYVLDTENQWDDQEESSNTWVVIG